MIKIFLNNGADIKACCSEGKNALDYAKESGYDEMVRALEAGNSPQSLFFQSV